MITVNAFLFYLQHLSLQPRLAFSITSIIVMVDLFSIACTLKLLKGPGFWFERGKYCASRCFELYQSLDIFCSINKISKNVDPCILISTF